MSHWKCFLRQCWYLKIFKKLFFFSVQRLQIMSRILAHVERVEWCLSKGASLLSKFRKRYLHLLREITQEARMRRTFGDSDASVSVFRAMIDTLVELPNQTSRASNCNWNISTSTCRAPWWAAGGPWRHWGGIKSHSASSLSFNRHPADLRGAADHSLAHTRTTTMTTMMMKMMKTCLIYLGFLLLALHLSAQVR